MSSEPAELSPDPVLEPFVRLAALAVERELDELQEGPDIAVIIARARELDPGIPEAMEREAGELADVVSLGGARRRSVSGASLAAFTEPARAELERRLTGATPLPRRVVQTWRWRAVTAAGVLAAAALVAIWVGVQSEGFERDDDAAFEAAQRSVEDRAQDGHASARAPGGRAQVRGQRDPPDDGRSLSELDDEAQRRWASGDVEGAEKLFERIVRSGERTRVVELAYGDLMAIARQRHDAAALARLRRAYLRRFPGGRFADLVPPSP